MNFAADARRPGLPEARWRNCRRAIVVAAAIAAAAITPAASACDDLAAAPTTRWSLATDNGVAWLMTPCGRRFFSLGVNALDGGYAARVLDGKIYYSWPAFAPSLGDWAGATRRRLGDWGFNSAGGWSLPPQTLQLPTIIDLELGRSARLFCLRHVCCPLAENYSSRPTMMMPDRPTNMQAVWVAGDEKRIVFVRIISTIVSSSGFIALQTVMHE